MDLAEGFNIFQTIGPNYLGGLITNEARMAIHWVHRLWALVVVAVVTLLALRLLRIQPLLGGVLFAVLATQVALGILNVVWVLPLINATAHNTVGALLLLGVPALLASLDMTIPPYAAILLGFPVASGALLAIIVDQSMT